ncbi:MAG TPA: UvrD-helicase domain-containing protein, partial [Thermoanaerobacterales bacterium]|nr:UvrD-helicase domain-containing protein [Thermoanaerobacterales bacterium]
KQFPERSISSVIGDAKDNLITPSEFERKTENDFRLAIIAKVYNLYQKKLKESNALDFDDLIMKTIELFTQYPDILKHYQDRFHYIMVDEYQDTNYSQYKLVRLLAEKHRNLCVVGDDDQSIYQWRGANIRNILEFEKDFPDTKVIKLEENYRSTQTILNAANEVIANNFKRKDKTLWTKKDVGEKIKIICAPDEHHEAQFIAGEIVELTKDYMYSDCAVLYRVHAQSRVIEDMFMKLGIPYMMVGGLRFYERKEIKDIIAYLRVVSNPSDNISLLRILNVPRRGIGNVSRDRLIEFSEEAGENLFQVIDEPSKVGTLGTAAIKRLNEFKELLDHFIQVKDNMDIVELIYEILECTEYTSKLEMENTAISRSRLENIREFIAAADEFQLRNPDKSLEEFLIHISLITDIDDVKENENAVLLMTLHGAKGLEFPNVFICGMEEGLFPHARSLTDDEELDEERRLCYVGMTRAEQNLYLTYTQQRNLYGNIMYNTKSRFLEEIPDTFIEEIDLNEPDEHSSGLGFNVGERIFHEKWGYGEIASVQGSGFDQELFVNFGDDIGIKHLILRYAPIIRR